MTFKLLIECSKDISNLHIDFTDGTSVVTESHKPEEPSIKNTTIHKNSEFLDTDAVFTEISQEVIQKPEIDEIKRPINVASELQNLDI